MLTQVQTLPSTLLYSTMKGKILDKATKACRDAIEKDLKLQQGQRVVLVHQANSGSELNKILFEAYSSALEGHELFETIDYDAIDAHDLKKKLYALNAGDVAILIQNDSFRMSDYRIRLDLKNRDIFVIEHNHLHFDDTEEKRENYVNALTCDKEHYQKVASNFEKLIMNAKKIIIESSDGSKLIYKGPFEEIKKNIGELSLNLGSFYPIGEVFLEPRDLFSVNGEFLVYAYPNLKYVTTLCEPFKIVVCEGKIVSHEGPAEFNEIIQLVAKENARALVMGPNEKYVLSETEKKTKEVWIREMGFGLNRNIGKNASLNFVSAHERQCGYHISLGLKHGVYRKKISKKVNQRYHIDMFVDVRKILIDDKVVFLNGEYLV